jgi:hypothetical protein
MKTSHTHSHAYTRDGYGRKNGRNNKSEWNSKQKMKWKGQQNKREETENK